MAEPGGSPPFWPAWLVDLLGPDYFSHAAACVLPQGRASDAVMAKVGRLNRLEKLFIHKCGSEISDAGMVHLLGLPRLRELAVTGSSLEGRVTGALLADLANSSRLQQLYLKDIPIRDEELANLVHCSDLRLLVADRCGLSDAGLAHLGQLSSLRVLRLRSSPVSDAGLAHLGALAELRSLDLGGTRVRGPGLAYLRGLSGLNVLGLNYTLVEEPSSIGDLAGLKDLSLDGCPLDDPDMQVISELAELQSLRISRTRISDAGLVHLAKLARLRHLEVTGSRVTKGGIATLQGARPKMNIDH
jgi:Leucine-rich repeat (LRR) protein